MQICARVLKAHWKLFPGTSPHSMPFDTWIIFLKFWRNLCFFPPFCAFLMLSCFRFSHTPACHREETTKMSKAKFVQRATIPSQEAAEFSCQQGVQRTERHIRMPSPAARGHLSTSSAARPTAHRGPVQGSGNDQRIHKKGALANWTLTSGSLISQLATSFPKLSRAVWL